MYNSNVINMSDVKIFEEVDPGCVLNEYQGVYPLRVNRELSKNMTDKTKGKLVEKASLLRQAMYQKSTSSEGHEKLERERCRD